jgi:hypothetical protein
MMMMMRIDIHQSSYICVFFVFRQSLCLSSGHSQSGHKFCSGALLDADDTLSVRQWFFFFQKPEEAPAAVYGVVSDRDEVSGGVFWLLCWVLLSSSSSSCCISLLDGSYFRRRLWAGLLSNYLTSQKLCVVSWWIMVLLVHENVPGLLRGVSFSLSLSLSLSLCRCHTLGQAF